MRLVTNPELEHTVMQTHREAAHFLAQLLTFECGDPGARYAIARRLEHSALNLAEQAAELVSLAEDEEEKP